ncbi:MAG: S24/S26 family peptidase [Clostridia bacterium]|nr:S24/S26 family peptidase [Clostridia bacterium]
MCDELQKQNIEHLLEAGKAVMIKPQGYSMYPVIVPGRDAVIVQKADTSKIKRGDVVLYRRDEGILVIHRLYKRDKKGYYMVGDNQTTIEGPLRADQIKGKMTVLIRKDKKIYTDSLLYRIPCAIWLFMRPVRRPVSLAVASVKRLLRKIAS